MSESNCQNISHAPSGFSAAPFPLEQAAFLARLMSDARVCRALHSARYQTANGGTY